MSAVEVWLDPDIRVGTLFSHRGRSAESCTFTYSAEYLAHPEAYPLDPSLPLDAHPFHSVRPLFGAMADSSPDRWGRTLVQRTLAEEARAAGGAPRQPSELDFLLGVRDDLRQGALRYRLPQDDPGSFRATAQDGVPVLADLGDLLVAADRVGADEAGLAELRRLVGAGSSLGGARPKAHVRLPGGAIGLAKFPAAAVDDWNVMAWEHVALGLAERAGIRVPPNRLVPVSGRDVLVVERFDRRSEQRVGYVSAMTMLELADGDRGSYLDIAEVVEEASPCATADLEELWRRIVLGALINNRDDHLRNHGFLREPSGWRLSPAFDLNPVPMAGDFATDVESPGEADRLDAALRHAEFFRLTDTRAGEVLAEVREAVSGWRDLARAAGLSEGEIRRMEPAFDDAA
ncbi:type II toxin-antitoxin system HipA family toxin [Kytococcus sp. Marseille-QA3725]